MRKLYSTIYFLFLFPILSFTQTFKCGWITDLHIGVPKADESLRTIVKDINKRTELEFVIITGDITERGTNEELELAKKILDSLKVKYYIIPGNHDTKWSESACTKFIEIWKDDKFEFDHKGIKFIGLNSAIPWRGFGGHISPEDLAWLDNILVKINPKQEIVLILHHPLISEVDNWFEVTNRVKGKNVLAVLVGHRHTNKLNKFNGIAGAISRSVLNKNLDWGYTLVENRIDTLAFFEINKDSIPKFWGNISKIKKNEIPKVDSPQFKNYNADVLWQKDLNKTFIASPLVWNEKIYVVSRSGILSCFDMNGNKLWDYDTYAPVFSRPFIADNILAVGNVRGDLITLDPNTGTQIQSIGLDDIITSQLVTINYQGNKLLMTGQKPKTVIIIGTSTGRLLCFDLNSLEPIWENNNADGMIETKPLFISNKIIYGSWDGFLYCVDARSGVMIWKWAENKDFYSSPAACIPITDSKNVIVTTPDKYISAIDLLLGKTVWRKNNYNAYESVGITSDKNNLFLKSSKDEFYFIQAKDGKIIKDINFKFGEDTSPSAITENEGYIIFGTQTGMIFSIDKNYKSEQLLFLGTSQILSVEHIKENIYTALNMDGNLVVFKLKEKNKI